ncbi:hypothetical protein, partial [Salmonella enterica]|uniref:hypothetical protein n=1 Tax=Salmonella enterica TaxID=28901 RepID=UPI001C71CDF2
KGARTAACCILLTASGIKIKCSEGAYTPRDSQYEMHHIILVVFIQNAITNEFGHNRSPIITSNITMGCFYLAHDNPM